MLRVAGEERLQKNGGHLRKSKSEITPAAIASHDNTLVTTYGTLNSLLAAEAYHHPRVLLV